MVIMASPVGHVLSEGLAVVSEMAELSAIPTSSWSFLILAVLLLVRALITESGLS